MPRRNKRKTYTTGKKSVFFSIGDNSEYKPECIGCAFAGYGGTCTTRGGTCLKTLPERRDADNAAGQR